MIGVSAHERVRSINPNFKEMEVNDIGWKKDAGRFLMRSCMAETYKVCMCMETI